jgi:ribosomal protein L37AE/L43A
MSHIHEYFLCDACECKDFKRIYNFSLKLHGVNFSEDLIYDKLTDEIYQCTKCMKTFTVEQVTEGLAEIKKKHRGADPE